MGRRQRLKSITTGWAARTVKSTRIAASVGRTAARRVLERALDRDLEGDEALTARESATARAMLHHMDTLKGLSMKLGQMMSYVDGTLPDDAQRVLRQLQRQSRPLELDAVRDVIESSLGDRLEALFDGFEEEPFAAASIGQVHRARLHGREVAVKVQYPQIARALEIDLGNLDRLGLIASLGSAFEPSEVLGELRERFLEECDYRIEAANQTAFRTLWGADPRVVVPEVVAERSSDRVLTTAFQDGLGFYDLCEQAAPEQRRAVGELIFEVAYRSIFGSAVFNADPHPGNYLFGRPTDRDPTAVTFLDFGCVRYFPAEQLVMWKHIAHAILDGRRAALRELMTEAGFVRRDDFDWDYNWQMMRYLYQPMTTEGFVYTKEYVRSSIDLFVRRNPNVRKTSMPRAWVMVNRLQWGLNSILAELGTPGDWPRLFHEALALETVPVTRQV